MCDDGKDRKSILAKKKHCNRRGGSDGYREALPSTVNFLCELVVGSVLRMVERPNPYSIRDNVGANVRSKDA